MTKIYAKNLADKILDDVTSHHFIQTVKGKMQRVVKVSNNSDGQSITVTTARRGVSSVSSTDVYFDTDTFMLVNLIEYYADKPDIYKVMYPELDTNIGWSNALGDKQ